MKTADDFAEEEFASFGPIQLSATSLQKSIDFWIKTEGLKLISSTDHTASLGSDDYVLVMIHAQATKPIQQGYSGLYHVAIHALDEAADHLDIAWR